MKKFIIAGIIGALLGAFTAQAVEVQALTTSESARWGATHRVLIVESDLTDTNLATLSAQTLTNGTIAAGTTIVPVALTVTTPFNINTATTNAFNFTTVSVGDSSSATQFVPATQINGNGTNVSISLSNPNGGTVAVALQSAAVTTTVYTVQVDAIGTNGNNVVTNIVAATTTYPAVVTNATATFTASVSGTKYYTSADALRFAFTAMTNKTLASFTRGQLEFYYKVIKP